MHDKECSVKEASASLYQTPTPIYASGRCCPSEVNQCGKSAVDVIDFMPIHPVPPADPPTCRERFSPPPNPGSEVDELTNSTERTLDEKEENKEDINSADLVVSVAAAVAKGANAEEPAKKTIGLHLDPRYMAWNRLDAFTAAEILSPQRIGASTIPSIKIQAGQVVTHLTLIQNTRSKFKPGPMSIESSGDANLQLDTQQSGSLFEGISF